ncbi:hypothetical protein [Massilia aquatica]|uniref:Uncharacterized protein n=1 Tax=Massilia aquatica TaxID=2609000 RepID=A0ABX0MRU2_9BURK|nr:hypothetical protein [Massilia aquatica]NHZ44946.1 hypothetical protein [Massilia aquatica]
MKVVYRLADQLRVYPQRVISAQNVALNTSPNFGGLKGTLGLFGSDECWDNIQQGKFAMLTLSGVIERAYCHFQKATEPFCWSDSDYAQQGGAGEATEIQRMAEQGVLTLPDAAPEQARQRMDVVGLLAALDFIGHQPPDDAAHSLGLSRRQVRR